MPDTTARGGLPYPLGSDLNNIPADLEALATRVAALLGAPRMSELDRDALDGADLYDGRLIHNTDTGRTNTYDATIDKWLDPVGDATSRLDHHMVQTSETTTSTSYVDLATVGASASVNVKPAGLLRVDLRSRLQIDTPSAFAFAGFTLSGANTMAADDVWAIGFQHQAPTASGTAERMLQVGAAFMLEGLNPGETTVTMKYRVTAGTGTFARRQVIATAI